MRSREAGWGRFGADLRDRRLASTELDPLRRHEHPLAAVALTILRAEAHQAMSPEVALVVVAVAEALPTAVVVGVVVEVTTEIVACRRVVLSLRDCRETYRKERPLVFA